MPWNPQTIDSERIAIHAALVPTPEGGAAIVYFDGEFADPGTRVYDINEQSVSSVEPAPDKHIMCSGHAFLGDGRLLVAGGVHQQNVSHVGQHTHDSGERLCHTYRPLQGSWEPSDQPIDSLNFQPGSDAKGGGRWYPTLLTVENGEVLAVAGHPFSGVCHARDEDGNCTDLDPTGADDYVFPGDGGPRHNNNTPERYSSAANHWTLLTAESTSHVNQAQDEYPRVHLAPSGHVFFSTIAKENKRFYNPYTGTYSNQDVDAGDSYYNQSGGGSLRTAVMLPILHTDLDNIWVLQCGGGIDPADPDTEHGPPRRINIAANAPTWIGAGERQLSGKPIRSNLCSVILPTGDIFMTGGIGPEDAAVLIPEIYKPPINWDTGQYIADQDGEWEALTNEAATVVRGYHSVALLMPDGRVWTAGSTSPVNEYRIEIYEPWYVAQQDDRPTVSGVPNSIGYGYTFRFATQANSIKRVHLIRCGSVTHAFDSDQRLISVDFSKINSTTLEVTVPFMPEIMPPGRYMLWVVDDQGLPCQWAPFIRISRQKALFSVDFDKFAKSEVDALGTPATFNNAVYLVYDSFLPGEVVMPTRSIVWKDDNSTVPGINTTLGTTKYEGGINNKDIAQRIVFPVNVTFASDSAFDAIPDDPGFREIVLKAKMGNFSTEVTLTLTKKLNPRMSDGDPHWLSIDLRAFSTQSGAQPFTADIANPASPDEVSQYIKDVLGAYNKWSQEHPGEEHPFEDLPTNQETNRLPLYSHEGDDPVYNFAVARVRFRAPELISAPNVRVFFRLWTTGWTALDYSTSTATGSYPRTGDGASATPLIGLYGGEINTIPCFAEARKSKLTDQTDPENIKTLDGKGADEVHAYYGCWLDFNQDVPLFPLEPAPGDAGPFGGQLKSIQELMRGLHQCLVAEIHYWPDDKIPNAATPASSDNLAQRNLLLDDAENPGGFASHLVHHTFEIKPSPVPLPKAALQQAPTNTGAAGRLHPDELIIDWGNVPRDSHVIFYLPQVNVDEILRYAGQRQGPANLAKAGDHAIRCKVTDVGFIPIPGPLAQTIAALVTIQLPPNITKGQKFTAVLRQVDGRKLRVIGTTQFDIHVKTGTEILPRFKRNLSVLRHIALSIPQDNRWYPVFQRYVGELADRVRALGANPEEIAPSSRGDGRPCSTPDRPSGARARSGKIRELIYDCFGDFEGFILEDCERTFLYKSCEKPLEEIIRRACRERLKVTVYSHDKNSARPFKIVTHCC